MARIAYLSSDVIVSVQAAQSIESEFSSHLHRYAARKDRGLVAATESGVPVVSHYVNASNSMANCSLDRDGETQCRPSAISFCAN